LKYAYVYLRAFETGSEVARWHWPVDHLLHTQRPHSGLAG